MCRGGGCGVRETTLAVLIDFDLSGYLSLLVEKESRHLFSLF